MFISEDVRLNLFRRRYEAGFVYKLLLAFAFAGLTGIGAQAKLYLPFTPVPITGQVLFVLLSGALLGRNWGALSMALYAALGAVGVPWFAGGRAGVDVLLGATGGYILGFVAAAYLIGYFTDTYVSSRGIAPQLSLMFAGIGVVYALGALQLAYVAKLSLSEALAKGVLPFIPGDIVKALAAVAVTTAVLPRGSYAGEKDTEPRVRKRVRLYLSGAATVAAASFLVLFWLRLLSFESAQVGELLWYSGTFSLAVLLCAWSALRIARS